MGSSHIKAKTQSYPKQTRSTLFELNPHHTSPHLNHVRLRLLLLPRLPEPEPILKLQPTRHKLLPKRRLLRISILPDPTTILPGQPCSLLLDRVQGRKRESVMWRFENRPLSLL